MFKERKFEGKLKALSSYPINKRLFSKAVLVGCCLLSSLGLNSILAETVQNPRLLLHPFPEGRYHLDEDPLAVVYDRLVSIAGLSFDSEQASNKRLDVDLVKALEEVNRHLADPKDLPLEWQEVLRVSQLQKITVASASRSPWHQQVLTQKYKAHFLGSLHLLGCAVDLEMKGKPFDVKRRGDEAQVQACYRVLSALLERCGLCFSEPVEVDPNHVELMSVSRKRAHESFDEALWMEKNREILLALEREAHLQQAQAPRAQKRLWQRLIDQLERELFFFR